MVDTQMVLKINNVGRQILGNDVTDEEDMNKSGSSKCDVQSVLSTIPTCESCRGAQSRSSLRGGVSSPDILTSPQGVSLQVSDCSNNASTFICSPTSRSCVNAGALLCIGLESNEPLTQLGTAPNGDSVSRNTGKCGPNSYLYSLTS